VLWSLNGYENYGRKPYQSFHDRLCQWSINNCNRTLSDDLSDYECDEEVEKSLREDNEVEDSDFEICSASYLSLRENKSRSRKSRMGNKYKRNKNIKERWENYAAINSSENNL
jgi:hypothetical protein